MTSGLKTIIYPVRDAAAATALYTELLGVKPHTTTPYYVGFAVGDQEIGLDPNGHASGMTGPLAYWHVEDIHATVKALVAAGATIATDVRNVGGSRLIASVTDADGNAVGLLQP
jgi:predicted enzyme related to lactoylglutathione lyase